MASVDTMTFDKPAYAPGDEVQLTVGYTPDTPSVSSQVFTATVTLTDPNGSAVATNSAPFTVNTPQAGDVASVADDGGHAWNAVSDSGSVAVFSTQLS